MKRLYWLLNKPWVSWPIMLRAIRVSHISRRLRDEAHAAWAHALLGDTPPEPRPLGHGSARWGTPALGWSFDPQDGFPYPPTK